LGASSMAADESATPRSYLTIEWVVDGRLWMAVSLPRL
jgi:hypothetical protein